MTTASSTSQSSCRAIDQLSQHRHRGWRRIDQQQHVIRQGDAVGVSEALNVDDKIPDHDTQSGAAGVPAVGYQAHGRTT
jgi:hypothetical protein